ncbi:subtilase family protein [Lacrimispora xylanisolvens]|uniref:Subtilase family protein n=1 Tax=Lacrimispora xylanisolvens TaxID=384636 RepID=A0A2S6HHA8_9FIRM|nr:S8 family peptidase [Hungatella xylanolytica]PPK76862.1 subtilase family protein [Hungatella xylanolytica]
MKKIIRAACLSLAILLAGYSLWLNPLDDTSGASVEPLHISSKDQGQDLHVMALGPGLNNLSPSDEFSTYQWGLKNDGEFRLIELVQKFKYVDNLYSEVNNGGNLSIPKPGPGNYESKVTHAVSGIDINIQPAWALYDQAQNKRSVIVAIIDTGIDINHQELRNAIWTNPGEIDGDGLDNDGNGYVDDIHGWNFYSNNNKVFSGSEDSHGTHAAGTISASRGSYGIAGITDNNYVKIMPLKALGGKEGVGSPDAVIKAIKYAEEKGASICNLSMGTTGYSEELAQTMKNSHMLFVVSCGNGGVSGLGYNTDVYPVYPASLPYDNIISVANILFDGTLSKDSNYGAASVDIAAPGTYILSTIPDNSYGYMSGTSMAAPMVTGVAAMLYSYRTDINLGDVKNIILSSSRKLDTLSGKTASGGLLDAYSALTWK